MTTDTDKPGAEAPAEDARSRAWDELEDGKTASAELKDDEAPPADAAGAEGDPDGSTPDGDADDQPPADPAAGEGDGDVDWSQAPAPLRAAYERMQKDVENERKRHGTRQSAADRRIRDLENTVAQLAQRGGRDDDDGNDADGEDGAPKTLDQHLAALKTAAEDFPEIGGPIAAVIEAMQGQLSTLSQSEAQRQQSTFSANGQAVEQEHPGYVGLIAENADSFNAWLRDDAPAWALRAWEANRERIVDAKEASRFVSAFKAHIGIGEEAATPPPNGGGEPSHHEQRRQRQRAAGSSPASSTGPSMRSGIPKNGSRGEIWEGLERQDEARRRAG